MKNSKQQVGELIFGIHPVLEVLKAKRRKIISIYTTKPEPKAWDDIQALMPKYHVAIQYVARDVLHKMAGTTDHQGIVAWVQSFGFQKNFFDPKKAPFLVMLDGIQDPRNVGAILRSAYCTGANGVVLVKREASPLTASAFKASAGLAEHLNIYMAASPNAAAQELKKAGYTMYLATFKGKNALEVEFKEPLCLVVGSEGRGVSKELEPMGIPVTLAQKTSNISYNASVASGILLYIIATQLKKI